VTDSNGFMTFGRVDGYTWAPLNQGFLLQITDLLPGNPYHELLRLSDAFGNWEFLPRDFATLRRRVRLEPTDLYINDDGDDFSNGEGSFRFTVDTWPDSTPGGAKTLTYSNGNLETGKSVTPVPGGAIVLGPDRVSEGTWNLRLGVIGTEDDSGAFPATGDGFASAQKDLFVPTGTIDEVVSYRPDAITASGVGDIRFTLSFKYWIEYL
jgi:hypothetical protein